jgi:3-oxoacyl-[acyl-carrier protein] reductase
MSDKATASQKTALISGGSRGIGAAAAKRLALDGFSVALTYVSRPDRASALVEEIKAGGGQALAIEADSTDANGIQTAVAKAVDRFGPIDAVVVNAGIIRFGTVEIFGLDDLDRMLAVNVSGVFLAIQAAASHMRDGGRVITIGGNTAIRSITPGSSVYAMTKAAVATMARA